MKPIRVDIEELSIAAESRPDQPALAAAIARELALRLSGGETAPGQPSPAALAADAIIQCMGRGPGQPRF